MEKKYQLKPVMVHLYCDKCTNVEMVEESCISNYYRTFYNYTCPKCGAVVSKEQHYPYTDYIETTIPIVEQKQLIKEILSDDKK